jgi:endonuclease-8
MPEGHTIHRLARRHKRLLGGQPVTASSPQGRFAAEAALLDGQALESTDAWGKHLFHRYTGPLWLHVHLGLYGKFADGLQPAPEPRGALRLRLQSAERWLDLRGPIACELVDPARKAEITAALGPDPLRPTGDPDAAYRRIARSRVGLAALLMDQSVVAGIGNVYRAEILFRHRLPPSLPGRELDPVVWADLWGDLEILMRAGVRSGRIVTTRPEDRDRPSGRARQEDAHYVYRRTGLPCRVCGTPIAQTLLLTRNLFWCPRCQDEPVG